ncbi:hypothetical protein [Bradyrhizobium elkanii]|nr:hypothetical protein [Bradyrhizobium elkanii]WLA79575.1 hypothetical protein QNJ99_29785 [Bradyrhizobium elkanii]
MLGDPETVPGNESSPPPPPPEPGKEPQPEPENKRGDDAGKDQNAG